MGKGRTGQKQASEDAAPRRKGRPMASARGVGKDVLIEATRALLQELPPAQVTSTAIARKAGADPALVRYYFGNRENLLFEVAKQIGEDSNRPLPEGRPVDLLEDMIRGTFRFTRSAKHMQRLMIEELDSASSPEVREKMRDWNRQPVNNYARILEFVRDGELRDFDPVFMYLAVVGICDFFEAGAPLLELLVPPGTDRQELAKRYEDFVVRLVTDGVRKR